MRRFRWFTSFSLSVFVVLVVLAGCASLSGDAPSNVEHRLVVLHTNDHHGHPLAFFDYPSPGQGGLPARATLVNTIRSEAPNVLVLDAGDLNTGRPESNFFKARPDIEGYNFIRYDALALGNHEFDVDMTEMQAQIAAANFPWLCANATINGDYLPGVKPYTIKSYPGYKVAVIGLVTARTALTGNPAHIKGITFEDEVAVAARLVPQLKKQADIVIALVHMGIYDDAETGSKRLAAAVPGLALIVDGHTHTHLDEPVMVTNQESGMRVPIVQAKQWGLYLGRADLTFKKGAVTALDWTAIPVNVKKRKTVDGQKVHYFVDKEIPQDSALLALLKPYQDQVEERLSEVIGTAAAPFINDKTREQETALGNIVADSQLWYMRKMGFDIDFAFQNGGGIRATLGAGEIQKKTVYEVLPFDNSICVVALKGSDVITLFDQTPATIGHGAMPQVSDGVRFTIDSAAGAVENLRIGNQPVDPERIYKIALNSYLAAGGDGYKVFKKRTEFYDSSLMQRDAFIDYVVHKGGRITPKLYGRITIK
ncbi:MAG: 5'-nucleotidase C-terminal domain-containing protein [Desulfosarcinaceae bacterium]|nr:5'-nucleotidase C-terminal domain-containing protein [Desulfosarcinaceae bacterium]